jgi:hypothetical protein
MSIVVNGQQFSAFASGLIPPSLYSDFKENIDGVLYGLGRDITVHLKPSKSRCPSLCNFNSTYKRHTDSNNQICSTCRGDGFLFEQRQTIYRANIRWTHNPFNDAVLGGDNTVAARNSRAYVRTKTVYDSYADIMASVAATVDGINVQLQDDPQVTSFGPNNLYVVTIWRKTDTNTNG